MKLKNVKLGQIVKVKKSNKAFCSRYTGAVGLVIKVESADYDGDLTVQVQFDDGTDWGNHRDIKLIRDTED